MKRVVMSCCERIKAADNILAAFAWTYRMPGS